MYFLRYINIQLPFVSEFVTVTVLGKYNLRNPTNKKELFPVGFRSQRRFFSLNDPTKIILYYNEILDGGKDIGPIFKVWNTEGLCLQELSSDAAWLTILRRLAKLKNEDPPCYVDGASVFGYSLPQIMEEIKRLPVKQRKSCKTKKQVLSTTPILQSAWHPSCIGYAISEYTSSLGNPSEISPVFMGRNWFLCNYCHLCHLPGWNERV